jgi:hypothetical protein
MPLDRFLVLSALVGVAGVQRVAHPFQHLVVEFEPPEQFCELRFERFFADIFAAAGSRVALAFAFFGIGSSSFHLHRRSRGLRNQSFVFCACRASRVMSSAVRPLVIRRSAANSTGWRLMMSEMSVDTRPACASRSSASHSMT